MSKPSVTIGIPAYNEAENIRQLLLQLLAQEYTTVVLREIIVVADACTDATVNEVRTIADPRIRLIEQPRRQGLIENQNRIARSTDTDYVVLFDADVQVTDPQCIEKLLAPMLRDPAIGIVSPRITARAAKRWFERCLVVGHQTKNRIYEQINSGENIYLCHGRARAFSRSVYQALRWPKGYPEDAYSYLFCRQQQKRFVVVSSTEVFFRCPSTWADHLRQSVRFFQGRTALKRYGGQSNASYPRLPWFVVFRETWWSVKRDPLATLGYVSILFWSKCVSIFLPRFDQGVYEPSLSSKRV